MNILHNSCEYSFKDLVIATNHLPSDHPFIEKYLKSLYTLRQQVRNTEVKKLCKEAGWFFQDTIGNDGIIYTSFSPYLNLQSA
jgi:hypothetical protein